MNNRDTVTELMLETFRFNGRLLQAGDALVAYEEHARQYARDVLDKCKASADELGLRSKGMHIENRTPAEAILDVARVEACDLIVMASHGRRGLKGFLLGSETQKVLTHSSIPVLVYR